MLRVILMCVLSLLLAACASTRMDFQLDAGKHNFINGDYKQAFHLLLPLASEGNAQAEYAVGYMYYYGYGVPLDAESGLFWMQRAADQGNIPARQALGLIQNQKKLQNTTFY